MLFTPLFSHADDDSVEVPLQTILDIGLHLAVLSNDVVNAKALIEMGADANSISKTEQDSSSFLSSSVMDFITYYQRKEVHTKEIQKEFLFERLRQSGIHMRPLPAKWPLRTIYIENVERAPRDWRWLRPGVKGGKPLEHALNLVTDNNVAMVALLYPMTRKEESLFPFYRTSEEEYLSYVLVTKYFLINSLLNGKANFLIKDMLSRDVKISSHTLTDLKMASIHLGKMIESLNKEARFLGIIKEGISDIFSTLWNEHPLINSTLQYGQYTEKFFKRLYTSASEADEKMNKLRALDKERAFLLMSKNLIDEAVEKMSAQGRIKDRQCQPGEKRTTTTGADFTCDRSHSDLGDAWRDPDGLIWGDLVKNDDGSAWYMVQSSKYMKEIGMPLPEGTLGAKEYCESIGARLPTREEFIRLREYMGAGASSGTYEGYSDQVLPNFSGYWLWSSSVDPDDTDVAYIFSGRYGSIYYGYCDYHYVVRCVVGR